MTRADDRPDDTELWARRASSFGTDAFAYAEHRPGYPVAAIRWALEPVPSPGRLHVLDLAGTGKLTSGLLAEGHRVTAVEPDEDMLAELCRRCGSVRTLPGTAERIPLPDGTVDAVLVGQAFHWFDPERAYPEIARVLQCGGVLAGLWNAEDTAVEWVAEFSRISESDGHVGDARDRMPDHPLFDGAATAEFSHSLRRTAESLVAMVGTHSHTLVMPEKERAELLDRMLGFLRCRPETSPGEFDVPLITFAKRMVRV